MHPSTQDLIQVIWGQLCRWTRDAHKAAENAQTRREELASFDWFDWHILEVSAEQCQQLWDILPRRIEQREEVINEFCYNHSFTQAIGVLCSWYEAHGILMEEWDVKEGWTLPIEQDNEAETPSSPLPTSPQGLPQPTIPFAIRSKASKGESSQQFSQRSPEKGEETVVDIKIPSTRSRALS